MADGGYHRQIGLGISVDVDTAKVKEADAYLNNFVNKYDDTKLKVDTSDFNNAAKYAKSLGDEINRVSKQSPKMLPALDLNVKQLNDFKAKYKDAVGIFSDKSVVKGIDAIFDKINSGGSLLNVDLGSRIEYLKNQSKKLIQEISKVGDLSRFYDNTVDYRSGDMDSTGIQKRIQLINQLIECQKELQIYSIEKLDSKDFESKHATSFLQSMVRDLQNYSDELNEFNLRTTKQLHERNSIIERINNTSDWEWRKGDGFEEYLEQEEYAFEDYINELQECVNQKKQLLKELQVDEGGLFQTDSHRWVDQLSDQIADYEKYIQKAKEARKVWEQGGRIDDTIMPTDFSEVIAALDRVKEAINEIKYALEPLSTAFSTEGTALHQMATEGSASLDTLVNKLQELGNLMDEINRKEFSNQTILQQVQAPSTDGALKKVRQEARETLRAYEEIIKIYSTMGAAQTKIQKSAGLGPDDIWNMIGGTFEPLVLKKAISNAKSVGALEGPIAVLDDYRQSFIKLAEAINKYAPGSFDMSKLLGVDSATEAKRNISPAATNVENILNSINSSRDKMEQEFLSLRQRLEEVFDFSTINPNYQHIEAITSKIYSYFVELQTKIKSLEFTIEAPNISKTGVDTATSVNKASESIAEEGMFAEKAAEQKQAFASANKTVAQTADQTAASTKAAADGIKEEEKAAENAVQAAKKLADAQNKIKNNTGAAKLQGVTKEDFEEYASQIAKDQNMTVGSVDVLSGANGDALGATVKLLNNELAQSITYTYKIMDNADGISQAFLTSVKYAGNIDKALKQSINAQKKADKEKAKSMQWLIKQQATLDKQETKYKYSNKKIDGSLELMSADTSLPNDVNKTIESLTNHIKSKIKSALSGTLTDEVKSEILNDLRILQNEIAVQQNMKYSATTMKASTVQTNKKAYEQFLNAFESRAKKANVFDAMEADIVSLRNELSKVTDASSLDKFVDNLKVSRNKLQAETAKASQEAKAIKQQEQEYKNLVKIQDKLYDAKKKLARLDESSVDGMEASRAVDELQQEYDKRIKLTQSLENYNAIKDREIQLAKELQSIQEDHSWEEHNKKLAQEEQDNEAALKKELLQYTKESDAAYSAESKQNSRELNNLYSERKQIISELLTYTKKLNKETTEAGKKAAQQAIDSAGSRLQDINKKIAGYGNLVDNDVLNKQDANLVESVRKNSWSLYIQEQAKVEKAAYKELLTLQSDYIKKAKQFANSQDGTKEQERLLDALIAAEEKYNNAKKATNLTKEQSIELDKNEVQLQEELQSIRNKKADKNDAANQKAQWDDIKSTYEKYMSAMQSIHKMEVDTSGKDFTSQIANELIEQAKAKAKLEALGVDINSIEKNNLLTQEQINALLAIREKYYSKINNQASKSKDAETDAARKTGKSTYESEAKALATIESKLRSIETYNDDNDSALALKAAEYRQAVEQLRIAQEKLSKDPSNGQLVQGFQDASIQAKKARDEINKIVTEVEKLGTNANWKELKHIEIDPSVANSLENLKVEMEAFASSVTNGKFELKGFNDSGTEMYATVTKASGAVQELTVQLNRSNNELTAYQTGSKRVSDQWTDLKSSISGGIKNFVLMYAGLHEGLMYFRQGVEYVREIDLAMTELKKVTTETDETYAQFLQHASQASSAIGSTVKDFTTVTSDFARLGYSINEASKLAETALIYENVGDGFTSVDQASESIISTMMAFGVEAENSMQIVDKFNEVGNNFAITSKGIGDALQRSASALVEGGNTIDEAIGLVTGANSVIQDPEQVGTALKTLSLRVRGAKTELEEAGLETDNMAESTAKLQEKLYALTNGQVNIMIDEDNFESTTEMLRQLAGAWDSMTDINQAAALEMVAGKRQANIVSSMLSNWDKVEEAIESSRNSEGSAYKENQKYLESLQGRIDVFNNAVQTMWSNMIDAPTAKTVVDMGTGIIKLLDTIPGKITAIIAAVAAASKIKGFSLAGIKDSIVDQISDIAKAQNTLKTVLGGTKAFDILGTSLDKTKLQPFANAVSDLNAKQQAAVLSSVGLSKAQIQVAMSMNDVEEAAIREATAHMRGATAKTQEAAATIGLSSTQQTLLINRLKNEAAATTGATASAKAAAAAWLEENAQEKLTEALVRQAIERGKLSKEAGAEILGSFTKTATKGKGFLSAIGMFAKTNWVSILISLIPVAIGLISKLSNKNAELAKEVENLTANYETQRDTINDTLDKLTTSSNTSVYDTLSDEFAQLAKGVSSNGENISLTSDQYERYRQICEDIVGVNPSLVAGFDTATEAIGNNVDILNQLVEAQERQARQAAYEYVSDDNLEDIAEDRINTFEDAQKEVNKLFNSGSTEDAFGSVLFDAYDWDINGPKDYGDLKSTHDDLVKELLTDLGKNQEEIDQILSDYYSEEGVFDFQDFSRDYADIIANSGKLLPDALRTWGANYNAATKSLEAAKSGMIDTLLEVPVSMEEYADFSSGGKSFVSNWIKTSDLFKIDKDTTTDDILDMADQIREGIYLLEDEATQMLFDSISNLDPSSLDWNTYQEQFSKYSSAIWENIGGKNNKLGFADPQALEKMLGFDSAEIAKQEDTMVNTLKKIGEQAGTDLTEIFDGLTGESEEDIRAYLDGLDAVEVQRLLKIDWQTTTNEDELRNAIDIIDFSFDFDAEATGIENLNSALAESVSATGLSAESIANLKSRYSELSDEGYNLDTLFEETTNGIHLNAKALGELEQAYAKQKQGDLDNQLNALQEQYASLTDQINTCSDSSERAALYAQRDSIAQQIKDTATLATQYEGLTSAYNQWQAAQSAGNERDMYEGVLSGKEELEEEMKRGWLDQGSREYLELLSGKDLSTANYDELLQTYKEINSTIGNSGYSVFDFFTQDEDGNSTTDGIYNFFDTVMAKQKELGEEWVKLNENGEYEFDLGVNGDKAIADALGISEELVQIILRAAKDAGFEIDLESAYTNLADLQDKAQEANDKLKEIGATDYTFNVNSTSIDDLNAQIKEAQSIIDSFNVNKIQDELAQLGEGGNVNLLLRPQVDTSELEKAGWGEQGEGVATVFTNTFSNEAGTVAINFTPIVADENGNYIRTLSPDELTNYAEEVIAGVREDDLNLQIGAAFEGENAIEDAEAAADKIHELHEDYYSEEVQLAKTMLAALLYQKQALQADSAVVLSIDVETDMQETATQTQKDFIGLIQQLQEASNTVELNTKLGADTEEAQAQVNSIIEQLNANGVTKELGLDLKPNMKPEDINAVIQGITAEQLTVTVGVNKEAVDSYQATEKEASGTVTWKNNTDEVDDWAAINHKSNGTVTWENAPYTAPTFKATGKITWTGDDFLNGTAHVRGTLPPRNSAYAGGSWGAPRTETALVGELGQELVVRGNRWFTVGDDGAEFTNIKKGDIIFNHKQTEALLSRGYVTGRGKAYASGTAYAFVRESGVGAEKTAAREVEKERKELREARKVYAQATEEAKKVTKQITNDYGSSGSGPSRNTISNTVGATTSSGSSSKSASSSSGSSSSNSSTDTTKDESEQVVDFIEIKLEEIEDVISKTTAKLENYIDDGTALAKKDDAYDKLVDAEKGKAKTYLQAAEEYNKRASELLSKVPSEYRDMAKNGAIEIKDFVGEDQVEIADAISEYREWAQKADDAEVGYLEAIAQQAAYRVEQLEDIASDFENLINLIDAESSLIEAGMDLTEESGERLSEGYYEALIQNAKIKKKELQKEKKELQKELNEAVQKGDIKVGSDEWYEALEKITAVDEEIVQCDTDIEQFKNSMNDLKWDALDKLIDRFDALDSELSHLYDRFTDGDVVDEAGNWTDEGISAMGMLAQQMEVAQYKSEQYADAINQLEKDYKKGLYSTDEYNEKLAELTENQWDSIEAYEDAKDKLVDLNKTRVDAVKDGMKKEIDAYKELIDKKKEALDAEKDLYDFEKSVAEKQKEISTIERKLAALSGDTSMSAAAQRKQLEAELAEAKADLEDTYYDRSISQQQEALDKEYEAYEERMNAEMELLDQYLENEEQVVLDAINTVKENASTVLGEINEISKLYGIDISDSITNPWNDGASAISGYKDGFKNLSDSFSEELDDIIAQEEALRKAAEDAADAVLDSINTNMDDITKAENPSSNNNNNNDDDKKNKEQEKTIKVGGKINAKGAKIYDYAGDKSGSKQYFANDPIYVVLAEQSGYLKVRHHKASKGTTGWFKKSDVKAYAKGTTGVKDDQFAWIDEVGEELVLHAGSDGKLTYLTKGSSVIPSDLTEKLLKLAIDPTQTLEHSRPIVNTPHIINNEINIDASIAEVIHIDTVTNDTMPDLTKAVEKQMDKYMKNLNNQIRKYAR